MPGKDRFGVEAEYWLGRAKRATRAAADRIEERTGAVTSARNAADRVASSRDRAVEQSAATRAGRATGTAVRAMANAARRLPLTGLTTDTIAARHGLGPLTEHLRANPSDPMAGARLVDALARAATERRRYRNVRTVVDPTSWVTRAVSGSVGSIGRDVDPDQDRLARSTWALAVSVIRQDPANGGAWHALALVHLARGDGDGARRFAEIAALADPSERPVALVTLARADLALGDVDAAHRSAAAAAGAGQTMGWDVLADAHTAAAVDADDIGSRGPHLDEAARCRALVDDDDRARYTGVHTNAGVVVRAVADAQRAKTAALAERARAATRAESAVLPPPRQQPPPQQQQPPPPPPPTSPPPPPTSPSSTWDPPAAPADPPTDGSDDR